MGSRGGAHQRWGGRERPGFRRGRWWSAMVAGSVSLRRRRLSGPPAMGRGSRGAARRRRAPGGDTLLWGCLRATNRATVPAAWSGGC
jgi:hypothetical protein